MLIANLIEKQRLRRKLNVVTPEGVFEVIYNGDGLGYEEVLVDDRIASRMTSLFWFVPRFEFPIGSLPATIEVSVAASMKIKGFSLTVAGEVVYSE